MECPVPAGGDVGFLVAVELLQLLSEGGRPLACWLPPSGGGTASPVVRWRGAESR